ncbi:hypothetical protein EUGRSUZ_H02952 [Eucalyptus grandis]|uniref:NB-ARC domain-containing protein n=2 Tax=Eucalyptus grandis TaxID=71139 RepID=A0A059B277_EUCGR|nr:hypothetical protein EUGRSUZ_H02952 [Eucalyptus grandis]
MAEGVLFSLATDILKSLTIEILKSGGSLAFQNIQLLCCAEGDLQSLEGTIQTIKVVLLDAEKQQWHNNELKLRLKRLKDVMYELHDLLDDVATEDLRRKVTSGNKMLKAMSVKGTPDMRRNMKDIENKNEQQLRWILGMVLGRKKYLLVLDDLWNDDRQRWLELQPLLMGGTRGSKILITTRNQSVVQATYANSVIHDLLGLSEDKSWELFKKIALGDGEESLDSRLEEIGRDIVKKCVGVPLAIKTIDFCIPPSLGSRSKHLRFLDFTGNQSIESLPDSITDLVNLQTLKLSNCVKLATLPRDLKKLVNFRHLLIDGCASLRHMPCGLNHLSSLRTLSQFIIQKMDHKVLAGVGGLDELCGLNRLAGSITLGNLEFLQPVPNKAYLREKQHLCCLVLKWSKNQQDSKSESDELILWENLRLDPILTNLTIDSCMSRSMPSWLSSIKNLVELTLNECREWKYLLPLGELSSLKKLFLKNLDALEFVQEIICPEQSNFVRPFFPSLEKLELFNCENLKGWWGRTQLLGAYQDHQGYKIHSLFPQLLYVEISYCPQLNSMPHFPRIETLVLIGCSIKWWEQEMAVLNYLSEAVVSTFIPLSKLESLYFYYGMDLEHSMLETLFPFLKNLKSMTLYSCSKLRSLSCGMQYLSSLLDLVIHYCEELDLSSHDDEQGTQWRSLVNLRDLIISQLPKLVASPEGIQHVTSLESLEIKECQNLISLPEWIGNFSSLRKLEIISCPSLTCLPNGMRRLTSLKKLSIAECPILEERCRRESGADWEKIAHLPCSLEVRIGY